MEETHGKLSRIRARRSPPLIYEVDVDGTTVIKALPVTAVLSDEYGGESGVLRSIRIVDRENISAVREETETRTTSATALAWDRLASVVERHESGSHSRLAIVDRSVLRADPTLIQSIAQQVGPACLFTTWSIGTPEILAQLSRFLIPLVSTSESDTEMAWVADAPIHQSLDAFLDSNVRSGIPGFQNRHVPRCVRAKGLHFGSVVLSLQIAAIVHDMILHAQPAPLDQINAWLAALSVQRDTSDDEQPWQLRYFPLYEALVSGDAPSNYKLRIAPRSWKGRLLSLSLRSIPNGAVECMSFELMDYQNRIG